MFWEALCCWDHTQREGFTSIQAMPRTPTASLNPTSLFEANLWGRAGKRKLQKFGIQTSLKGESRLRPEQPSQSRRQDTNTSAFPTFRVFLFHSSSFPPIQGQIPTGVGSKLPVLWVWTWRTRQGRILLGITAFPMFWIFLSCPCSLLPPHPR